LDDAVSVAELIIGSTIPIFSEEKDKMALLFAGTEPALSPMMTWDFTERLTVTNIDAIIFFITIKF
jgi:hypothetical protein